MNEQVPSDELFKPDDDGAFEGPGIDVWPHKQNTRLYVCTGDSAASLTVAEARALCDYINKVLP
jgi:hypothetical protein